MAQKRVSIVLPVYNGADYVEESIKSVLAQTYSEWELIIVNDCSTDETLAICERFAKTDARIKVITNETNRKLPNSLNIGFAEATGAYYTWTSDDNIYKPNAIETMVKCLETDPEAVMVYSDYTTIDSEGNACETVLLNDPEFNVTGNTCGACFLYTAEIAEKVGKYDSDMFLAEDYDYWLRMLPLGKMIHITDNLYYYRYHSQSLTETKKEVIKEQAYEVLEKNFQSVYDISNKNNLTYEFFDYYMYTGSAHREETYKKLIGIKKGYKYYLLRRRIKNGVKRRIKRICGRQ
ncbi:MAG: glycosyltransferase family 2 protein [Lachnospiraceae bacterium]|nr:glycosyltransferase family 2 protein [Lachnospiraceae bacterium]